MNESPNLKECRLCRSKELELIAEIREKPRGETDFAIPPEEYHRTITRCRICSVFLNFQNHTASDFYEKAYHAATYGGKLLERFEKVRSLPPERSDNKRRVERVANHLGRLSDSPDSVSILDVGSGLCVFLAELAARGYRCHAIDPDPRAIEHAMKNAGIEGGHAGSLNDFRTTEKFDLIAFNKVLEHVTAPVELLSAAKPFMSGRGVVYVELPDGEAAREAGGVVNREEFWIEHHLVFGLQSFKFLAERAGFCTHGLERIHEPSDKYTILGFLEALR